MNLVRDSSVGCWSSRRGKKKRVQKSHAANLKQSKISKIDKNQAECFFCKKLGHWKRNCSTYIVTPDPNRPKIRKKKQTVALQDTYMITLCNFSSCNTNIWVLDIESLINIYNSLQEQQVSRKFREDEQFLNVGDGSLIPVLALKILQLVFESSSVMLDECYYYPSFLMNDISVGLLAKLDFKFIIKDDFCDIIMNDTIIIRG